MKRITILFLLVSSLVYSQKKRSTKVGSVTKEEVQMASYEKDTTANALVLYEHANTYLSERDNLDFKTDYYHRIKLFDRKSFHRATVKIRLYQKEKSKDIEAYSYNIEDGVVKKTKLVAKEIFKNQLDENWKEVVFTIPNINEGTVIEYQYSVVTPYLSIDDWYFQSDIPKLESDFSISYLGNYKYNSRLIGFQKFSKNEQKVEKRCVNIPGVGYGNCANFYYGMQDVPAFKEEDYMLSKENFLSRISFDLISITNTDGRIKKYTQTWKDADMSIKDDFLDGQTSKKKFFFKNLPKPILEITNPLEKAEKIYQYIQNRFAWDGRYWTQKRINLKEVFEERNGSVDAINLSLYNSLQAANIESYIVMIATRNRGLPTRLYPITTDFNYVIVKAVVGDKTYFLDATDKFLPFGQIPLRSLNGEGRVLDFIKGSYWEEIQPAVKTSTKISVNVTMDENVVFTGNISVEKKGYHAIDTRRDLSKMGEDDYLENLENTSVDYEIEDYKVQNLNDLNESLLETLKLESDEGAVSSDKILINPFLFYRFSENPFKLKTRNYPVDFGYPTRYTYIISLKTPKEYKVTKKPETVGFKLPNNGGMFLLRVGEVKDGTITLNYRYQIKKRIFSTEEYHYLKEFLNKIIKIQASHIELEKI
tara:strand:+ start:987 stop:2933 length:1947 start_codon:yes stop_codon:yes gene_type:complete